MVSSHFPRRNGAAIAALFALAACQKAPILWREPVAIASPSPGRASLSLDAAARPSFVPITAPAGSPSAPLSCPASIRYAQGDSGTWFAAWWAVRTDSSAALWAARSDSGGMRWLPARMIDSTDVSVSGCRRAAPALAAWGDYVHVAYSMRAKEGPGVFYVHSMDGGRLFHPPLPIVYGERLGATAVAADADRVVVAYEDPNGESSSVSLAISANMGHIFGRRVSVSGANGDASAPQVALHRGVVAVSWIERSASAMAHIVRIGVIQ